LIDHQLTDPAAVLFQGAGQGNGYWHMDHAAWQDSDGQSHGRTFARQMNSPAALIVMYFVLPLWLAAGFVDWLCHRASHIEKTAGAKESLLHLLMFAEVGAPLLAAIFLEIDAGIFALMILAFFVHEATALWDVSYAAKMRNVTPFEQHVHGFLELLPLTAIICIATLHWGQFLALFGFGPESAHFGIALKREQLPTAYVVGLLCSVVVFAVLPYVEELIRCLRAGSSGPAGTGYHQGAGL
jgi:hypothetical protein